MTRHNKEYFRKFRLDSASTVPETQLVISNRYGTMSDSTYAESALSEILLIYM
jgi:hypothetical protein